MPWLQNLMIPEISNTSMFLNSAKEIWNVMEPTYSKAKDVAQIWGEGEDYGCKTRKQYCYIVRQSTEIIVNGIRPLQGHNSQVLSNAQIEQDRVYEFLVGLKYGFDQVRV